MPYGITHFVNIGWDNGLSPIQCQAITWANVDLFSTGPLFCEIKIKIIAF